MRYHLVRLVPNHLIWGITRLLVHVSNIMASLKILDFVPGYGTLPRRKLALHRWSCGLMFPSLLTQNVHCTGFADQDVNHPRVHVSIDLPLCDDREARRVTRLIEARRREDSIACT